MKDFFWAAVIHLFQNLSSTKFFHVTVPQLELKKNHVQKKPLKKDIMFCQEDVLQLER